MPTPRRARSTPVLRAAGAGSGGGLDHHLNPGAIDHLEKLYATLPALACRGLCAHSCSVHVDASTLERSRIAAVGVDLAAPTVDAACPALSRAMVTTGICAVHAIRPTLCRL